MFDLSAPDTTVRLDVLRRVVNSLDGNLFVGHTEDAGRKFFVRSVEDVQDFISNNGMDVFLEDARGAAPGYGSGTPVDLMDPTEMLRVAAAIDATDFDGIVSRDDIRDLESAVKWTLVAIYDDVFSAIGKAITDDVLGWDDDRLVVVR